MRADLKSRMAAAVGTVSTLPDFKREFAPPPKEEEIVPDIQELIPDFRERSHVTRLIQTSYEWARAEREAKAARKPITEQIKKILGAYQVGKCKAGDVLVNYYDAPRTTLSKEKLLEAGVPVDVIMACMVTTHVYSLRLTGPGEKDED